MNFIRKPQIKSVNSIAIIGREIRLIKKYYSFIDCKSVGKILYCNGHYQPTSESPEYQYLIKYEPIKRPVVTVTSHDIEYNDDIHLYPEDNSLCLYHQTDLVWDMTCHLHDTIIPWTHEWFVFYELYLLTGFWLHPFVPHKKIEKQ